MSLQRHLVGHEGLLTRAFRLAISLAASVALNVMYHQCGLKQWALVLHYTLHGGLVALLSFIILNIILYAGQKFTT